MGSTPTPVYMVKNVSLVEIYRFGRERGQVSFLLQKKRTSFLSLTEKEDKFPFSYRKRGQVSFLLQKKRTSFLSLTEKEDKFPFSYRKRGQVSFLLQKKREAFSFHLFFCFFSLVYPFQKEKTKKCI